MFYYYYCNNQPENGVAQQLLAPQLWLECMSTGRIFWISNSSQVSQDLHLPVYSLGLKCWKFMHISVHQFCNQTSGIFKRGKPLFFKGSMDFTTVQMQYMCSQFMVYAQCNELIITYSLQNAVLYNQRILNSEQFFPRYFQHTVCLLSSMPNINFGFFNRSFQSNDFFKKQVLIY